MVLSGIGWRPLIAGRGAGSIGYFSWLVWVREAVNALLPVARIGGELLTIRLMTRRGIGAAPAVASLVVDLTLSLVILLLFTATGLLLLHQRSEASAIIAQLSLGLGMATLAVGGIVAAQWLGAFGLSSRTIRLVGGDRWLHLVGGADRLDRAVRRTWRRRWRVVASALWQSASWLVGVVEIWIALAALGHPVDWRDAVIIEALIQAVGQAAFVVPGAIGVQEGGFVVLGTALGVPAETALALGLIRRARDFVVYVPALIAWQALEGSWLVARLRRPSAAAPAEDP